MALNLIKYWEEYLTIRGALTQLHKFKIRGVLNRMNQIENCASASFELSESIWVPNASSIARFLDEQPRVNYAAYEELRLGLLRGPLDPSLRWILNRIRFSTSPAVESNSSLLVNTSVAWSSYRLAAVGARDARHFRESGPVMKKARIETTAAFCGMYLCLRSVYETEGDKLNEDLAVLARNSLLLRDLNS